MIKIASRGLVTLRWDDERKANAVMLQSIVEEVGKLCGSGSLPRISRTEFALQIWKTLFEDDRHLNDARAREAWTTLGAGPLYSQAYYCINSELTTGAVESIREKAQRIARANADAWKEALTSRRIGAADTLKTTLVTALDLDERVFPGGPRFHVPDDYAKYLPSKGAQNAGHGEISSVAPPATSGSSSSFDSSNEGASENVLSAAQDFNQTATQQKRRKLIVTADEDEDLEVELRKGSKVYGIKVTSDGLIFLPKN